MIRRLIIFIAAACLLTSCEKDERALVLPPPTGTSHASVNMGADYDKQVFFDFETGSVVLTNNLNSWDLAFEAAPDGRHVFLNNGKNVRIYNTHQQVPLQQVTQLPDALAANDTAWQYDAPCGLADSTAVGNWWDGSGTAKGEVYIVEQEAGEYQKMHILSVGSGSFTIEWAPLNATGAPAQVSLTKDPRYNFVHFSFKTGALQAEPPKDTWDVVFSYYKELIFDDINHTNTTVPYLVTGVLLNPAHTSAAISRTADFASLNLGVAQDIPLSIRRNTIGYDWKTYNFSSGQYQVNRAKTYLLQTRKEQFYKLHFLDFYESGVKGNPLFEYERLQ